MIDGLKRGYGIGLAFRLQGGRFKSCLAGWLDSRPKRYRPRSQSGGF